MICALLTSFDIDWCGEGGIRTLGTSLSSYNGLANRPFRPLRHLSVYVPRASPRVAKISLKNQSPNSYSQPPAPQLHSFLTINPRTHSTAILQFALLPKPFPDGLPFPHPKPRKHHNRKHDPSHNHRGNRYRGNRSIDISNKRNAQYDMKPADYFSFGRRFHDR